MKQYKNLCLIGTSHIAIESVKKVDEVITGTRPDIVAVELDQKRFYALVSKKKRRIRVRDIKEVGFKGFLFNLVGAWIENKLGKTVGIKPGADMMKAIECAQKIKAKLALIDQDISITLKRLSKSIKWKEKLTFVGDIIKSVFLRNREVVEFDLRKVPSDKVIKKLTKKLREKYPSFYKVLIEERNVYMAKALYKLMMLNQDKEIVAVVGAGHEEDIVKLIQDENTIHGKRS